MRRGFCACWQERTRAANEVVSVESRQPAHGRRCQAGHRLACVHRRASADGQSEQSRADCDDAARLGRLAAPTARSRGTRRSSTACRAAARLLRRRIEPAAARQRRTAGQEAAEVARRGYGACAATD